jgi:hypothetical protein
VCKSRAPALHALQNPSSVGAFLKAGPLANKAGQPRLNDHFWPKPAKLLGKCFVLKVDMAGPTDERCQTRFFVGVVSYFVFVCLVCFVFAVLGFKLRALLLLSRQSAT